MPSFRYRTYGLNVESDIECPNLQRCEDEPQVRVSHGAVPEVLKNPLHEFGWYQSTESEFLLNLEGVGRFWVSRGDEIRIEPASGADEQQIQAYAFGSIFGVLLHQRRQLPLHASAIETDRGAVLFTGPCGFGKSTLAGEFSRRGYPILADDIGAITSVGGVPHLHPARPTLLLNADSMDRLCLAPGGLVTAPHNPAKRLVPVESAASSGPIKVRAIYALNPSDRPDVGLTRLSGFDKVATLAANVYRVYLLNGTSALSAFFEELTVLADSVNVVRVERPSRLFLLAELADQIEEDLKQCP